ncbi:uncharacterized protein BJX67DRAFT_379398 [Aspergillus lucknowensis]|uniref:polynucleotide adenylyltransferase n=1 Tax=Aspergillus lucknowensis TaxID=176173 RepID=A0ABR4LXX2_9EURO
MASLEDRQLPLTSYETALCVIPPSHLVGDVQRLRALYDKAHGRWPPHVNLIYPFVAPEELPRASKIVQSVLAYGAHDTIQLRLDKSELFSHRRSSTIYLTDSGSPGSQALIELRRQILDAFEHSQAREPGPLHLTIGQSDAENISERQFLLEKAALIPAVQWEIGELAILIRDRSQEVTTTSRMEIWGTISLAGECAITPGPGCDSSGQVVVSNIGTLAPPKSQPETGVTFQYRDGSGNGEGKWVAVPASPSAEASQIEPSLAVSSYNVLIDSPHPPPTERYPILLQNLLSTAATADILVLQEVSDEFLSFLLKDPEIRQRYPFATHGPPDQADISPLTSLRNIVMLSRWCFHWEWLPFEKRHKGAVVLQLDGLGVSPFVVAGLHLTCGLSDGSILAKRSQLQTVLKHLSTNYAKSHWIVAGDFNITTSSYTIDAAMKRKSISQQAASVLSSLDGMLAEAGLSDCYFAGRAGGSGGDLDTLEFGALYEGEEGATFDPTGNELAARIVGQSFHGRPQRYDRILVRGERFSVFRFNQFGVPESDGHLGSDHWGIRAVLRVSDQDDSEDPSHRKPTLGNWKSPPSLGGIDGLMQCLRDYHAFPSTEEIDQRREAIQLIGEVVNQRDPNLSLDTRLNLSFAVVPVGSYGLGVWTGSSDIDLLAIGQVSPRTFFALIVAKLRRATDGEIKILRKVKAASGTMLELEVRGVRADLQYCAATRVAESWPQALQLPADDPAFDLPMQSLLKLNPVRDMHYLQRTIPDLAAFRLAYRFIKIWAQRRGIYSSKLGYLGGIHIAQLLSRVCKLSFSKTGPGSPTDLIVTFFRSYAQFPWHRETVYDPGFYKTAPRYFRSAREPIVILTQHVPKVNVARSASLPSSRTLEQEFKRMDALLSRQGEITWTDLLGPVDTSSGVEDFLTSYPSYVKVNVQHWGAGAMKGRKLVGWLEWRCVSLLVDIQRKFPDIHARIWPTRFTDQEDGNEDDAEYQGCYLIGLTKGEYASPGTRAAADRQSAEIALIAFLNTFAEQIRGDEKYFDASSNWVDVALVSASGVRGLRPDSASWVVEDPYDDDDDDDEDDEPYGTEEDENDDNQPKHNLPIRARLRASAGTTVSSGGRLRPASDVLSRLRWDPNIDIDDYIVGYDDRFLGDRETPVAQWKAELTDEAFIPTHRILYFRRKSDGVRVWDRENRVDLLFNSGLSGQTQEE